MNGLELSRKFYTECGRPLFEEKVPELLKYVAFGLCGQGSECFGLDDDISRDHDFEPGFCVFIPDESVVDRKAAFALEHTYLYLPKTFMGFKRGILSPAGGNRHGVIRISDFFASRTGYPGIIPSDEARFGIPDMYMAEAVNGEIFEDNYGLMTEIRSSLCKMPPDILKKKLAGHLVVMSQSGEYNYMRCIERGDPAGAQMSLYEFVRHTLAAVYIINGSYMPYYKLAFKGLRKLAILQDMYEPLLSLISSGNSPEEAQAKHQTVSYITSSILSELLSVNLISSAESTENAAFEINGSIKDNNIRNTGILYAVD